MLEPTTTTAICFASTQRSRDNDRAAAIRALVGDSPTIYAVRLADGTIKIGCTTRMDQRRKELGSGSEILAFQPGDYADEQAIHLRLVEHRARGHEYYHPTAEVMAAVNRMRDHYGLPHLAA